ncbi:MAG: TonB-dependent receptor [Calditrichaeota bacterium]|nr:TonB-dependent receptor [Calditrichota bacterium]MCB9391316.1 TonB-dependent receptor [Calditrichota bacterium]
MKRCLTTFLHILALLSLTSLAFAGPGKISGTIVDESGDGVFGAAVQLVETQQGATVLDPEGSYVILGVAPGIYTVRISSVGHQTKEFQEVSVSSDLTTTINATLALEVIGMKDVDIVVKKNPTVILDETENVSRIKGKDLQNYSGGQVATIIAKQPGFKVDPDGGLHVRGGRDTEAKYLVDGISTGGALYNNSSRNINTSALNVEEIEILTGGDASTGGYQSALIRVTTPEGKMDKYNGTVEYRTDRMFQNYSFDTDQYDYSFSGPVPFAKKLFNMSENKLTFFTSGAAKLSNTYTPYAVSREDNDYLGLGFDIPERQSNDYSTFWKLTYRMDPTRKFNLSYSRDHSLWDIYPSGEAAIAGNYGWQYKYAPENRPYVRDVRETYNLQFQHNVSQNTFYEVSLGRFQEKTRITPRGKNPDQFTQQDDIEDGRLLANSAGGADVNSNGIPDGYRDANGDGEYNGEGEGYDDVNGNGRWDRGEDWVDLNGNGVYDAAEPWVDRPNSQGLNNPGVYDPWDPFVDLNGNGRWDDAEPQLAEQDWNGNGVWDGERFQDANGNGSYDGYGEGYDDRNGNGSIDRQSNFADEDDTGEGLLDGDYAWDTGEPFIDLPDEDGFYNGEWDEGEVWLDLPSSNGNPFSAPTRNGRYDPPGNGFDEFELFCYPADLGYGMDPRLPVVYTWANILVEFPAGEPEWLNLGYDDNFVPLYYHYIEGRSTWINRTRDDTETPVYDARNGRADEGETFYDYNNNGQYDPLPDDFLNPGQWDISAFWQDRHETEYSGKFNITSQVNKFHELKSGLELKYREVQMQSIQNPDEPYDNEDFPLPSDAPYFGIGGTRDFYDHKPWEGAVYFQDKMEFEGLIVRAGIRSDFIIQGDGLLEDLQRKVDAGQPGALLADRGRYVIAPRLGISHPVSLTSKLYFNYGHYYQTPSFQYFYRSATANISPNTEVGNPNLEYEKTVSYEVGVSTEFTSNWVIDVAGYYRDVYNQIGTVEERIGPITLNRYFNLGYARARGFEFSVDKKFSNMWALTANYDFSFAYGKESAAAEGLLSRLNGVPENRNEHPLDWDETHRVSAFLTLMVAKGQNPEVLGMKLPSNWLSTVEFSYGSGLPYTPSTYIVQKQSNLILANSARQPATSTTDLRFDKFWELRKGMKFSTGFEISNLFNRKNVRDIYSETGNAYDSSHELNQNEDDDGNLGKDYDHNPRNYFPPRQVVLHLKLDF